MGRIAPFIQDKLNKYSNDFVYLCQKHYLKTLYIFGSATTAQFNGDSDIDFLYEIDLERFQGWDKANYDYTDNLLSFEKELNDFFERKVDLIPNVSIPNKYIRRTIEETKQLIYAT